MLIVIFDGGICQFEDMYFHAICACVVYDTHTLRCNTVYSCCPGNS